jgi:hypothetical protein
MATNTKIRGGQINLTDFISTTATSTWTSNAITASQAAILAKIRSEIAGVAGAMTYRGDWSQAATDTIKQGYVYVYAGTGTVPTGVTLEEGDTLIAKQDGASVSNVNHWTIVQVNITGAITEANLISKLFPLLESGNTNALSLNNDDNKITITAKFPTISNGGVTSNQYVSGLSINSTTGAISVSKGTLPTQVDYREYFVYGEEPTITVTSGSATVTTANKVYDVNSIAVFVNGVRQLSSDFTVSIDTESKAVVTFTNASYTVTANDNVTLDYIKG